MKHTLKYIVGGLMIATLAACGGGGGGSSSPSGPGAVGALGTAGYFPAGSWTGSLVVQNPQQATIMQNSLGLCSQSQYGYQGSLCNAGPSFFQIQISVPQKDGNMLPGQVSITLTPNSNGTQLSSLQAQAAGAINAQNNGMLINYTPYQQTYGGYSNGCPPGYPCTTPYNPAYTPNNGVPTLQIVTQYLDQQYGQHAQMNVQLIFNGVQIAAGQVNISGIGAYGPQNTIPYTGTTPYTGTPYYNGSYPPGTYYFRAN